MEFLKELIQIQHSQTINNLSKQLLSSEGDQLEFITKFNKPNYCLIKISNCKMPLRRRVKVDKLISNL